MRKIPFKAILLVGLIVLGIALKRLGIFDWYPYLHLAESYAHHWWFPLAIVLAKTILYTFALPGSIFYWVAGLVYPPLKATLIITLGGVTGAIAAFAFSQRMASGSMNKIGTSRFFRFIQGHSDFITLCAIRTLPTFPHSVINYGSGILHVPWRRFIFSTTIGFGVKGYLYASTIRHAALADEMSDCVSMETMLPFMILVLLFIAAKIFQRKYLQ